MKYIDVLARFGAGSAHPGGLASTRSLLRQYPLGINTRILEIGCGTGKTACMLASLGHRVTAVDLHSEMIRKAKQRAAAAKTSIEFIQADAASLPFRDGEFDVVLVESVFNFADRSAALSECYRVLVPGGCAYIRELMLDPSAAPNALQEFNDFFGLNSIVSAEAWTLQLKSLNFSQVDLLENSHLDFTISEHEEPDEEHLSYMDEGSLMDEEVWEMLLRHDDLMTNNALNLRNGLIRAVK
ncbi:class I SAM-dependent methyltransferase [Paenibacillus gansuensis]|uniref:Class I SAM-dependent methyltransferase n=1 Tax=Paenibacillus gansuensis TaxID=306542 RepID=A0ABW5P8W0_9BACL